MHGEIQSNYRCQRDEWCDLDIRVSNVVFVIMFMDHVIHIYVQTWQNNYDDVCVIALDHTRVISLSHSYFSDVSVLCEKKDAVN